MNISYSSPDDWFDSRFTVEDLNDKIVEFSILGADGYLRVGQGRLIAVAKGSLMRVRIVHHFEMEPDMSALVADAIIIPGSEAHKLIKKPPGSKCDFSYASTT